MKRLFPLLGLLFLTIPLIEIALFIAIGDKIGLLATIAIVIATGVIGAGVISRQGLAVIETMQKDMDAGNLPVRPVLDGVMLIAAALLMITPGFFTDALGLVLAIPSARHFAAGLLQRFVKLRQATTYYEYRSYEADRQPRRPDGGGPVIEGEIVDDQEEPRENDPPRR